MAIVTTPPKRSIEDLRSDLTDKLGELHRRAVHAKEVAALLGFGGVVGEVLRARREPAS